METAGSTKQREKFYSKYRIAVMNNDEVLHKLGISAEESAFKVMDIARRELNNTLVATHVSVRDLTGKELELRKGQSWLTAQLLAFRLKRV